MEWIVLDSGSILLIIIELFLRQVFVRRIASIILRVLLIYRFRAVSQIVHSFGRVGFAVFFVVPIIIFTG